MAHVLDSMIAQKTGFTSFADLANARGSYTPTCHIDHDEDMRIIADAYDAHMVSIDCPKRAYRVLPEAERKEADRIAVAEFYAKRKLRAFNEDHRQAQRDNLVYDLAHPRTPVELANSVKAAAKACIAEERRLDRKAHLTHRGVEVIAADINGDRVGNGEPEFLTMKQINGREFQGAAEFLIKQFGEKNVATIYFQGGVDAYESFAVFMRDSKEGFPDYEPMVGVWDIEVPVSLFNQSNKGA